jgi:endonuclease-8
MPEGDTIYRSARALGRALAGKAITRFETGCAQIAAADDQQPFVGQAIAQIEARGKWLLIHFADGRILATHMLMSGSWHIYRPGERWQESRRNARIVLETADFVAVAFRVPVARILSAQSLARDPAIPKPERDVLGPSFDTDAAILRLKSRSEDELAHALLRQTVLAGVGNVFKSEICFLTGLSPFRSVDTLSESQLRDVVSTAQRMLAANVLEDSGGQIVTYSGRKRRTTRNADPGESLWVYGRRGKSCRRCGAPIERCLQGPQARVTYWCPVCQPVQAWGGNPDDFQVR